MMDKSRMATESRKRKIAFRLHLNTTFDAFQMHFSHPAQSFSAAWKIYAHNSSQWVSALVLWYIFRQREYTQSECVCLSVVFLVSLPDFCVFAFSFAVVRCSFYSNGCQHILQISLYAKRDIIPFVCSSAVKIMHLNALVKTRERQCTTYAYIILCTEFHLLERRWCCCTTMTTIKTMAKSKKMLWAIWGQTRTTKCKI